MSDKPNTPDGNANISGNTIQGSIVGVGGQQTFQGPIILTFGDMAGSVQAIPNATQAAKADLAILLKQLETELSKADPDEADEVKLRLSQFLTEAKKAAPDSGKLNDKGNNLKKAAEDIAGAMPTVLGIAINIVTTILGFPH